jgi:3-hydroxyisobutyrate dehydrogenase-like beta-hydroxyacid dehydrogenase
MSPSAPANESPRVGFIGFGEVAAVFSSALKGEVGEVLAFDVLAEQPGGMERLAQRAGGSRIRFVPLSELVARSNWILSTVPTDVAESVARRAMADLAPGKYYLDLNATAPAVKQAIAKLIAPTGAHFVEGAILTAVGVTGARTRILIGDAAGPGSAEILTALGLNAAFYHREIGRASAFKLLRSIFSKGLEALLLEFLVAGRRAGLQDELWREVVDLFVQNSFERVAENWVRTHATAHERRYHEVVQVAEEMRALGLDPVMTEATEAFFARSIAAGLKEKMAGKAVTVDAVIAALETASRSAISTPTKK